MKRAFPFEDDVASMPETKRPCVDDKVSLTDGTHTLLVPRASLLAQSRMYAALVEEMHVAATLELPKELLTPAAIAWLNTEWFGLLGFGVPVVAPKTAELAAALINVADYLDAEQLLDYAWSVAYRSGLDVRPWLPHHLCDEYHNLEDLADEDLLNYVKRREISRLHGRLIRLALRGPWPRCSDWSSVFSHACFSGDVALVDRLLADSRVDPAANDNAAIHVASEGGNLGVVSSLLADPRVNPGACNNYAISSACRGGHVAVVDRLLAHPRVDPTADHNYAIFLAAAYGHHALVKRLLADPRVNPADVDNRPITVASERGYHLVVHCLLADSRVDPSDQWNYAIRSASERGHREIVECFLADPRVDPTDFDNAAIRGASERGHVAIVECLLADPRVDPAARHNYAIRKAAKNGHLIIVQLLVAAILKRRAAVL